MLASSGDQEDDNDAVLRPLGSPPARHVCLLLPPDQDERPTTHDAWLAELSPGLLPAAHGGPAGPAAATGSRSATAGGINVDSRATERADRVAAPLIGLRVLAVDDEWDALAWMALILRASGASVRTAGSAHTGLGVLATWSPDVVLSDIDMPEHDGY